MTKSALRRTLRARRRTISVPLAAHAALALAKRLSRLPHFRRARDIGIYWPMDGEISLLPLLQMAAARKKRFYLPVLVKPFARSLRFASFSAKSVLRNNRFTIPEPRVKRRAQRPVRHLDLLLMPLVGFDRHGHRLGMGGGFYDRSLAHLHHRTAWQRPRLVGVAYSCQEVPLLPVEPWDVPLHALCTETGCFTVGP